MTITAGGGGRVLIGYREDLLVRQIPGDLLHGARSLLRGGLLEVLLPGETGSKEEHPEEDELETPTCDVS